MNKKTNKNGLRRHGAKTVRFSQKVHTHLGRYTLSRFRPAPAVCGVNSGEL